MKDITLREKVEAIIFDTSNWSNDKNYQAIQSFCIDELLQYGIDPRKHIQRSIPDADGPDLTKKRILTDYLFHDKFNLTPTEETRAHLLIDIYNYCKGLKIIKAAILRPKSVGVLQKHLNNPEGIYDSSTSEISFEVASKFIAQLTYMLTLTLRNDFTQIELDIVQAKIEKFHQDRVRGGKSKAEVEAKAIVRERARQFLVINPHHTKSDLIVKITSEMQQDKVKYKLKRDIPSFDTLSKWLVNLDRD